MQCGTAQINLAIRPPFPDIPAAFRNRVIGGLPKPAFPEIAFSIRSPLPIMQGGGLKARIFAWAGVNLYS
jgi:hypothetical protein